MTIDSAPADSGVPPVESQIDAINRDWSEAMLSNDVARIARYLADDWVIVSDMGITTREQFLGVIGAGELTHSAMDPFAGPRVRVYGDTGVLTGRVTSTASYGGTNVDTDEWETDIFVKDATGWRCVLTHLTAVQPETGN